MPGKRSEKFVAKFDTPKQKQRQSAIEDLYKVENGIGRMRTPQGRKAMIILAVLVNGLVEQLEK